MLDIAGNGALFVNPFEIESIRNGFLEVISNVELQKKLISEGRENVKRFDAKIIAQQYIKLYEEVLLHNINI